MDTTNKSIASIGIRFAVAIISLMASSFLLVGVYLPESAFLWATRGQIW